MKIVQQITEATDFYTKHTLFRNYLKSLHTAKDREKRLFLIPLMYDWHFGIRYEAAFLVDYYGVRLQHEERYQWLFAMLQFELLKEWIDKNPLYRWIFIQAFLDRSEKVRARALRVFHMNDCVDDKEKILYFYGRRDYLKLWELAEKNVERDFIRKILVDGTRMENNYPYHRRQCAILIQNLRLLPEAEQFASRVIQKAEQDRIGRQKTEDNLAPIHMMEKIIDDLRRRGLYIDDHWVYPEIQVGTVTNRITYRNPGVQTWSKEERKWRIQAPPGYTLLKYDFREIEPRLFFHFLLKNLWISLKDIPDEDIYALVPARDRDQAKRWLNAFINGANLRLAEKIEPLKKLLEARKRLQDELLRQVYQENAIQTIGGNKIPLNPEESNLRGKAVNRLIQGSAADLFHRALMDIQRFLIQENLDAWIYFVIFDEFWVACRPELANHVDTKIYEIANKVWKKFELVLPITVRRQWE